MQGHIIWHETLDSTNKEAHRYLEAHLSTDKLTVIASQEQTSGRGQGDHRWHSAPGENLTFSLLIPMRRYHILARNEQIINSLVTPVICSFLERNGVHAWVKKPNDIWVGDRKICGILIENVLEGPLVSWSIVGIGLNVNEPEFPEDLPNPVSLRQLTGRIYDIKKVLDSLVRDYMEKLEEGCLAEASCPAD